MKYLLAGVLLLTACAGPIPNEMMIRPDSRRVSYLNFPASVTEQIIGIFADSLPKETGICAVGHIEKDEEGNLFLRITDISVAKQDSSTRVSVMYHLSDSLKFSGKRYSLGTGCTGIAFLVGYGHDHPPIPSTWVCTASDQDALFLAQDLRFLFLMTVCLDGRFEVLWQDGRRQDMRWGVRVPRQ